MRNKTKLYQYIFRTAFISFCLIATLISITQSFNKVSAVESSSSATASVTVSSACSFSRTNEGDGNYAGTLANNSSVEVSGSTFTTFCNDPGGYAIYAIGYSNNEYGNTDLIYNNEPTSTYNIKTNPAISSDSNWKMKLTPVQNNFTPTIENNYNNYSNIPSNYTKVASYNNVTMNDSDSTTGSSITASYQATASSTQPAGTYTGAVKYTMVHPSATPAAYFMQDVADWADELPNPGDTFQAVDRRDGKAYWVARLADGNIWMTQNLDLDVDETKTYTHYDTDLGYTTNDPTATWQPAAGHSTIDFAGDTVDNWVDSNTEPYSANPGNIYYYTSSNSDASDIKYNSLQDCQAAGHRHTDCEHYHVGNYYNWSAAVANNNTVSSAIDAIDSVCPANWRLPNSIDKEISALLFAYSIVKDKNSYGYLDKTSFSKTVNPPLWLTRSGFVSENTIKRGGQYGFYTQNKTPNGTYLYSLFFSNDGIYPNYYYNSSRREYGFSIRCLARTED